MFEDSSLKINFEDSSQKKKIQDSSLIFFLRQQVDKKFGFLQVWLLVPNTDPGFDPDPGFNPDPDSGLP